MNIYETWLAQKPIAHRGLFNEDCPENSIAAFKNAIKNKFPIEFDVTAISDGTPVVFHDERLARMTGGDGFITNATQNDLAKLTLAKTKEKIPTLQQVLEIIDGKVPILIEIKNFGKVGTLEKEIWKLLQNYNGDYAIESFNPYTLEWFKINAPKVKRGQLASFFKDKAITGVRRFALKRMLLNKKVSEPNFIVYNGEDMPNKYTKKYLGKIPVIIYTLKSPAQVQHIKSFADNYLFDGFIPKID